MAASAVGPPVAVAARRVDSYAIVSLVCSIAAFGPIPLVGSILGIVFGRLAQQRIAADPGLDGDAMARAGLIIGWIGVAIAGVVALIASVIWIFIVGSFAL